MKQIKNNRPVRVRRLSKTKQHENLVLQKQAIDCSASVAESDCKGIITYANDKFCELSGFERPELLGKDHRILNSSYHPKEFFALLWQTINAGKVWAGEIRNKTKEGSIFWVNATIYPVQNNQGGIEKFIVIQFDITARKEFEASLKESEEKFRSIFEKSADGMLTIENNKFIDCNDAAVKMLGYTSRHELLLAHPSELSPPTQPDRRSSFEKAEEMIKTAKESGYRRFEWIHRRADGSDFPVEVTLMPLTFHGRRIVHTTWRDLSEHKDREEKLIKLNTSLLHQKLALDSAAIVAETDIRGKITYVNDKFIEISQYSSSELIGKDHRLINSGHHPKAFFTNLWHTISSGEIWRGEIKNKAKDGSHYWVNTTIYPMKDEHGKIVRYAVTRFDITDKKRVLEELQLVTDKAQLANRAKSEFLANMSHEIRTPMNAIIGMADLLAETELNAEQKKYVHIFQRASENLLIIINNILDLSKVESGHTDMEEISFNLLEIIEEVVTLVSGKALSQGIKIITQFDPGLGPYYIGDPTRIKQILSNLLGNAIKFTVSGEVRLIVSPNSQMERPGNIFFSISDTGIGISKEHIDKLFNIFSQADSSVTRKFGGTGLGLSICKKLVEMMNGHIWVESEEGKGTTFRFTLALPFASGAQFVPKSSQIHCISDGTSLRILVVDDSEDNRILIQAYLKKSTHQVDEAENGLIAIEKVKLNKYDLIFMDVQMPELDGLSATEEIVKWQDSMNILRTPIIALTAHALEDEVEKCYKAGCSEYLSKPFKKVTLLNMIAKYIASEAN